MILDRFLLGRLNGCRPYARFILNAMIVESRDQPQKSWQLAGLRERLGIKEATLRKHLTALEKCGVLERRSQRIEARGRPPVSYQLAASARSKSQSDMSNGHGELLSRLFSGENLQLADLFSQESHRKLKEREGEEAIDGPVMQTLSIEGRLLFACLLSRADRCGFVQIGTADLALYTGMAKSDVGVGIERLKFLGLIRMHVQGVSCKIFKEGKLASAYLLNLEALGGSISIAIGVHTRGQGGLLHSHRIFGDALWVWRNRCFTSDNDFKLDGGTPVRLAQILATQPRDAMVRISYFLQLKLYQYAAEALTRRWAEWNNASDDDTEAQIEVLAERIRSDFRRSSFEREGDGRDFKELCQYFYTQSIDLARDLHTRLSQTGWIKTPDNFCVLPVRRVSRATYSELTLIWAPAPSEWRNIHFYDSVIEVDNPFCSPSSYSSEHNLPLHRRFALGLIAFTSSEFNRAFRKRVKNSGARNVAAESKKSKLTLMADALNDNQEPVHEDHTSERGH